MMLEISEVFKVLRVFKEVWDPKAFKVFKAVKVFKEN